MSVAPSSFRWRGGRPGALLAAMLLAVLALALVVAWRSAANRTALAGRGDALQCHLPPDAMAAPHAGMVWVPGGTLEFGDTVYAEEQPLRRVPVAGFWMDRTEVTNAAFSAFVKATGYVSVAERQVDPARHPGLTPDMRKPGAVVFVMPNRADGAGDLAQWWRYVPGANWRHPGGPETGIDGRESFPVVAVTYADAMAYARWKGHSLPSEAQWEWAARAGGQGTRGDTRQPEKANTWQGLFPVVNSGEDGFVGLAPVGCYPPSSLGLYDMIGNVWELTVDRYTPFHAESATPEPDQVPPGLRPGEEDLAASHLGFRTILSAPGP